MGRKKFDPRGNLEDLPEDLIGELKLRSASDEKVIEVFREGGGVLNISEVLVGYYKIHGEVKTRRFMTSKLYRMRLKNLLEKTGKKGEYKITAIDERKSGE